MVCLRGSPQKKSYPYSGRFVQEFPEIHSIDATFGCASRFTKAQHMALVMGLEAGEADLNRFVNVLAMG